MGRHPPFYCDSQDSVDIPKKKKKLSIFKCGPKKKRVKLISKSEPSESDVSSRYRSRSNSSTNSNTKQRKLVGILKNSHRESSDDDDDPMTQQVFRSQGRCLVGQVPRTPGTKPGRGGGVAFLVRKNVSSLPAQSSFASTSSTSKTRKSKKHLSRKGSF